MLSCHSSLVKPSRKSRQFLHVVVIVWLSSVATGQDTSLSETVDPAAVKIDQQLDSTQQAAEGDTRRSQVTAAQVLASVDRGIDFLVATQNSDGSWGQPTRTKDLNIYAPVPGAHHAFRMAVTALCISALCEQEGRRPELHVALDRGQSWMLANLPLLRRATADAIYNVWGHGYSISALVALHGRSQDQLHRSKLVDLIKLQYERLTDYESVDGGWGYYDFEVGSRKPAASSTSFVNATVLVGFWHAKAIGVLPPEDLVERAIRATVRQRKSDFSYLYGEYLKYQPARGINRPGGSLGRSQACNIALRYWGDAAVTDQVLLEWLERLILRHGWLDMGRKRPIPHEAWMQVAGYFFYYGHFYAALCCEQLPGDQQHLLAPQLAALLVERQEKDGSWWDYPFYNYHPPYGTAFALMSLNRYQAAMATQ